MGATHIQTTRLGILCVLTAIMACGEKPEASGEAAAKTETTAETKAETTNDNRSAPAGTESGTPSTKAAPIRNAPAPIAVNPGQQRGPRFVLNDPIIDFGDVHDFEKRSAKVSGRNWGHWIPGSC